MDDRADLSHLADVVQPAPVPWWPPAPGWWIIGAAFLISLLILSLAALLRYRRNAYRRAALAELSALSPATDPESAAKISAILKRVALVSYPRTDVARLSGSAWLAFLDGAGATHDFTESPAAQLVTAPYSGQLREGDRVLAVAQDWVRNHRVEAG